MQFIDLKKQYKELEQSISTRIKRVFEHGQYILGPEIFELEQRLAEYTGAKHCITVSSGTDALLVALLALDIKAGDEVITSPFSFIAAVEVLLLMGVKPVFVDIDPKTYNIDPNLIEATITPKTKAILPVNLFGQCADYSAIQAIADKFNLVVIEDAAQSFGATYKGRQSCNLGDINYTSFFPAKPLGCYGDGGACFTNNDDLAASMRQVLNHGQDRRYHHIRLGINGRFDTLQAAILLAKMEKFPWEVEQRQKLARMYDEQLSKTGIRTPYIHPNNTSVYAQYTISLENRDQLAETLKKEGIPTAVHYPLAIHQQPVVMDHLGTQSFPVSEAVANTVLSLPFHPYLDFAQIKDISQKIADMVVEVV